MPGSDHVIIGHDVSERPHDDSSTDHTLPEQRGHSSGRWDNVQEHLVGQVQPDLLHQGCGASDTPDRQTLESGQTVKDCRVLMRLNLWSLILAGVWMDG